MSHAWEDYQAFGPVGTVGEPGDVMAALGDDAQVTLIAGDEDCETAAAVEVLATASGEPRYQSLLLEASIERGLVPRDSRCPAAAARVSVVRLAETMAEMVLRALCGAECGHCVMLGSEECPAVLVR